MSTDRERVAAYVALRRGLLGLSQVGLAKAAGVDTKTVNKLEKGRTWPQATTLSKFERALELVQGSLQAMADGRPPQPLEDAGGPPLVTRTSPETLLDLIRDLDYLTEDDIALLQQQWDASKETIVSNARRINEARSFGRRRKRGA
jgi:transcriptional regulator with XRE-family HTH domain